VRILVEGRPGVGKTTFARRVVDLLRERDVPVAGFTTEEVRERGRRVGFALETAAGDRDFLAHVEFPGPPRVGRYGVELATMERLALPALESVPPGGVVVVDELGKMELASEAFTEAMIHLFHQAGAPVLATVHVHRHPVTDRLKARKGVELVRLTQANRDDLPAALAGRLAAAAG
jgi:nucleoside-triphosphatase